MLNVNWILSKSELKLNKSEASLMDFSEHDLSSCTAINHKSGVNYWTQISAVDDVSHSCCSVCFSASTRISDAHLADTMIGKAVSTCSRRRTALRTSGGEWFWPGRPSWTRGSTSRTRKTRCSTCISCSTTIKTEIWGSCPTPVSVFSAPVEIMCFKLC